MDETEMLAFTLHRPHLNYFYPHVSSIAAVYCTFNTHGRIRNIYKYIY